LQEEKKEEKVTDPEIVEITRRWKEDIALDRTAGILRLSHRYFPEADPRYFRVYGMDEHRKLVEERERAKYIAKCPVHQHVKMMGKYMESFAKTFAREKYGADTNDNH
jgi:hypothetical protein